MSQKEKSYQATIYLRDALRDGVGTFTHEDFSDIPNDQFIFFLKDMKPRRLTFKRCIFNKSLHKYILTSAGREVFPANTKFIDCNLSGYKIEEGDIPYLEEKAFSFKDSMLKWPDGGVNSLEERGVISENALASLEAEIKTLVSGAEGAQDDEITQILTDLKRLKKTDPSLRRKFYVTAHPYEPRPFNLLPGVDNLFEEAKTQIMNQRGVYGRFKDLFRGRRASAKIVAERFLNS